MKNPQFTDTQRRKTERFSFKIRSKARMSALATFASYSRQKQDQELTMAQTRTPYCQMEI